MGVILSGILSGVSGKVAGVVGGRWKDKHYLRAYTIPANPDTAAQQVQRTKFKDAVNFAKPMVGQVFNTYTDKFQKSMSGFNFFIKRNIDIFDGAPNFGNINITEGPLSFVTVTSAQYVTDTVTVSYNPNNGNNGLDSDDVFLVVYDESTGIFYFAATTTIRTGGAIDVLCETGLTAANLHSYTFTSQYIGAVLQMISYSWSEQVTV